MEMQGFRARKGAFAMSNLKVRTTVPLKIYKILYCYIINLFFIFYVMFIFLLLLFFVLFLLFAGVELISSYLLVA